MTRPTALAAPVEAGIMLFNYLNLNLNSN